MPLVNGICKNCGGELEVDSSLEAAICPYCNTPYIVEKAIENYNIAHYGPTYINNATFINESEFVRLLDAAEGYEKLEDYANAYMTYVEICKKYPHKFEGWYGAWVISLEIGIYHREHGRNIYIELPFSMRSIDIYETLNSELYNNAKKLADSEQRAELTKTYDQYNEEIGKIVEERKNAYNSRFGTFSDLVAYLGTNNIHLRNAIGGDPWKEIYRKGKNLVLLYSKTGYEDCTEILVEKHLITGYSAGSCKFHMPNSKIKLYAEDYSIDNLYLDYNFSGTNTAHFVFFIVDVDGTERLLFFDEDTGRSSSANGIKLPRFLF